MIRIYLVLISLFLIQCQNIMGDISSPKSKTILNLELMQSQKIIFFGTSLTAGGAWVGQLTSTLFDKYGDKVKVINSGKNGMDSNWGINNVRDEVLKYKPDCVFIEFGINDVQWTDNQGLERSKQNLNGIIDSIYASNENCEIILMTMNTRNGDENCQKKMFSYYEIYREITKERNILLVDNYYDWMYLWTNDRALFDFYVPDGVHPTFLGHECITTKNILFSLGLNADPL
jgi:acyl-CoA thioesterase I